MLKSDEIIRDRSAFKTWWQLEISNWQRIRCFIIDSRKTLDQIIRPYALDGVRV